MPNKAVAVAMQNIAAPRWTWTGKKADRKLSERPGYRKVANPKTN